MDPLYKSLLTKTEIEHIRDRNRIAKRQSRARRRQKLSEGNALSRDENESQLSEATSEVMVGVPESAMTTDQLHESRSPITSDDENGASTYEPSIDAAVENSSWNYPALPVTAADQLQHHVQFEDSSFTMRPVVDVNELYLTPPEAITPTTVFNPNTTSHTFSQPHTIYQQNIDICMRHPGSGNTRNAPSSSGLLHLAIRSGSESIAQALLAAGASANSFDDSGALPLHLAVQYRRTSMADLLLAHGADPDAANVGGITPLEMAVRCQDEEIVKLLISKGARVK